MKTLLPVSCRPSGYVILFVSLFIPFLLVIQGMVAGSNLLFYKECTELLTMSEAVIILFALSRNEGCETEVIRNKATRNAIFLIVLFLLEGVLCRVATGDIMTVDISSFPTFLIIDVPCLKFGTKEAQVDKIFRR